MIPHLKKLTLDEKFSNKITREWGHSKNYNPLRFNIPFFAVTFLKSYFIGTDLNKSCDYEQKLFETNYDPSKKSKAYTNEILLSEFSKKLHI